MGLYMPVLNAVKGVLKLQFAYIPACLFFGIGIILGVFGGIGVIKKCLAKHRSQTVYLIIGLMIGSIYAVLLGPTTLEVPQAAMSLKDINVVNIICFIIGGVIIFGLERLKTISEQKK
jgi:putative membrane protein